MQTLPTSRRWLGPGLSRLILLLASNCQPASAPAPTPPEIAATASGSGTPAQPQLVLLGPLLATTEPCGCSGTPLGGLDALAGALQRLQLAGPVVLVVAGDVFTPAAAEAAGAPLNSPQGVARTALIDDFMARLHPSLWIAGAGDWSTPALRKRLQAAGALTPGEDRLLPLGEQRIGWMVLDKTDNLASLRPRLAALRLAGADLVGMVAPAESSPAQRAQLAQLPADWLLILEDATRPAAVQVSAGAPVRLQPVARGEQLALMTVHGGGALNEPRLPWQFDDGGAAARGQLQTQAERWRLELLELPSGPARAAREGRLAQIEAALAAPPPTPPAGPSWGWSLLPVARPGAPPAWAEARLRRYNLALCDTAAAATAARGGAPDPACAPLPGEPTYLGSASCQGCHAAAWATYAATAHARAWATLERAAKQCDLSCVSCHSVGHRQPGGFCEPAQTATYANVGCESCHGPGSLHAAQPTAPAGSWGAAFLPRPGETTCRSCHQPAHSHDFNFTNYLPRILGPGHQQRLP